MDLWTILSPVAGILATFVVIFSGVQDSCSIVLDRCHHALGMESRSIPDDKIFASSSYEPNSVGPQNARLNVDQAGGAWCPKRHIAQAVYEYLEIHVSGLHIISAVQVQGRFGNGEGQEFAEAYYLEYWRPGFTSWRKYKTSDKKEILKGNSNTYMSNKQQLNPVIIAERIRFVPYSTHPRMVCMRVELYGCVFTDGLISYTMRQGENASDNLILADSTYDGVLKSGILTKGLGQLADGIYGGDDYTATDMWQNVPSDKYTAKNMERIFPSDKPTKGSSYNFDSDNGSQVYIGTLVGIPLVFIILFCSIVLAILFRNRQRKYRATPESLFKVPLTEEIAFKGTKVFLCEMLASSTDEYSSNSSSINLTAVKTLNGKCSKISKKEFYKEIDMLKKLNNRNIANIIGIIINEEPMAVLMQYLEYGDLHEYLQSQSPEDFKSKKLLRNCLLGKNYLLKISDIGRNRKKYQNHYLHIRETMLPIRWMAWESLFLNRFTTKSDVWSFAMTMWEIFTLARLLPYTNLSDEEVIKILEKFYNNSISEIHLAQPSNCSKEIYDLMLECWKRNELDRPNFVEINLFLQRKNLGYKIEDSDLLDNHHCRKL